MLELSPQPNAAVPLTSERFALLDGSFTIAGSVDAVADEVAASCEPLPERAVTIANGLFGTRGIAQNFSQELVQAAWSQGERWRVFRYSETASYRQDDHTAAYMRVNDYVSSRQDSPVRIVGYSRGCFSAEAAHSAQPELVDDSVYIAPPGCTPFEGLSKAAVIIKAARLALRDGDMTMHNVWNQAKDATRRQKIDGLRTTAAVGISAARHILGGTPEALNEICKVLQVQELSFTDRLVALHKRTAATSVFSCEQDAFCPSDKVERSLEDHGYDGDMYRLLGASHSDVLARPHHYAADIVRPLC